MSMRRHVLSFLVTLVFLAGILPLAPARPAEPKRPKTSAPFPVGKRDWRGQSSGSAGASPSRSHAADPAFAYDPRRVFCPPATTARTRTALCFRTRLIHIQRPAAHIGAVQSRDCPLRFAFIRHLHESKAPGPPGLPIGHDAHSFYRAIGFEERSNRFLTNTEIEVAYKNIFQVFSLAI